MFFPKRKEQQDYQLSLFQPMVCFTTCNHNISSKVLSQHTALGCSRPWECEGQELNN